jgi:leucyl-tRNA synthetase
MSKSKGNTVAPDDVIAEYGADTLRLYILAVAPPEMHMEWKADGIEGERKLLHRVWRVVDRHAEALAKEPRGPLPAEPAPSARALRRKVHQTIQRVTADIDERIHLNTAVAAFHELVYEIYRVEAEVSDGASRLVLREALEVLVTLMNPFTPHACEEMWARLGNVGGLVDQHWPVADAAVAREDEIEIGVQVNGKIRGRITVAADAPEETVRERALQEPRVKEQIAGKQIVKVVVVPGRLVSVVVK